MKKTSMSPFWQGFLYELEKAGALVHPIAGVSQVIRMGPQLRALARAQGDIGSKIKITGRRSLIRTY